MISLSLLYLIFAILLQSLQVVEAFHIKTPVKFLSKTSLFARQLSRSGLSFEPKQLDSTGFNNASFQKLEDVTPTLGKYRLQATVKAKDFKVYLGEYQEEMKRRKVVFPGFRPGKIPPSEMGDVRRHLVCFGLENIIGGICDKNSIKMCSVSGEPVQFGEDAYYEEIIQKDARGYGFTDIRDSWREGTDLPFAAEFYALQGSSMDEDDEEDDNIIPRLSRFDNVIDATAEISDASVE